MRVRVIRAFKDTENGGKTYFEGSILEMDAKRAKALEKKGVVKLIDPEIKQPTGEPKAIERKPGRPRGRTKVKK